MQTHEGFLKKNEQGRYSFSDGYYFTSGDRIEIFADDIWIRGHIEYSQKEEDYYFVRECEGIYIYNLNGVEARVCKE